MLNKHVSTAGHPLYFLYAGTGESRKLVPVVPRGLVWLECKQLLRNALTQAKAMVTQLKGSRPISVMYSFLKDVHVVERMHTSF